MATTPQPPMSTEEEVRKLRAELDLLHRRLADANKMASLGRLAAGIVHEINTPIGSILSNNEVVGRALEKVRGLVKDAQATGSPAPPKATDLMETIASLVAVDKLACERISSIVRSLKTFARVGDSDLRKVDVNDLLRSTMKLTAALTRQRITVEADLGDLPEIECYPGLLAQVFLNLIVNAAQAIPGTGTITVRSRHEGLCVHVSITDTGQGIRPEDQARIFSAGFTTKPVGEGTGLGLTITREIVVDTHGGVLEFESEWGVGTTFHVRLPVVQPRKDGGTQG